MECPWDSEQTPRDIIGYTVEEVHELADAIAAGDLAAEHGELGDLLLQVVLLSLMLEEEGAGDLASVAHDIEVKLIRRHPHIFADAVAETPKDVKDRWERIKVEQEGRQGIFHDVPAGFPALLYAKKLQQRAASVGFDWDSAAEAFPKIAEEHAELAELFQEAAEAGRRRARRRRLSRPPTPSPTPTAPTRAWPTRSATCCSPRSTWRACCTSTPSSRSARPATGSSGASRGRPRSPPPPARTGPRSTSGPGGVLPAAPRPGSSRAGRPWCPARHCARSTIYIRATPGGAGERIYYLSTRSEGGTATPLTLPAGLAASVARHRSGHEPRLPRARCRGPALGARDHVLLDVREGYVPGNGPRYMWWSGARATL